MAPGGAGRGGAPAIREAISTHLFIDEPLTGKADPGQQAAAGAVR